MLGIGLNLEEFSASTPDYPNTVEDDFTSADVESSETGIHFQQSLTERSWMEIAAALSCLLDEDKLSDEEESGEPEIESEVGMEDTFIEVGSEVDPGMRSSGLEITSGENEWFPWPNRLSSQCQLDLLTWILQINGVQDVPSEMANPHVRSKLHFYPEDSGKLLYEAHQARRCGQVCTPTRWFQCKGLLFGKAWPLRAVVNDAGCGWIVEEHTEIEISQEDLLVSFENWSTGESTFSLPPSHNIIGVEKSHQAGLSLEPWTLTKPHKGNKWHALAKGAHMLDGFITQLEAGQETGIWAWDCIYKEWILVIPSVLALLGDNPMQIKGHDAQDITTTVEDEQPQEHSDGGRSDEQVSIRSEREGIIYKKHDGSSKQEALDEFIQGLPKNVYSPVWHIKDSPVEVLHTVLLGFVKYFWRDVVNVRIGKNKTKLELVETHLSSFDTTGLGISPLSGHTLVQYAGSLMGHDFQEIA
ncbi:hypothetical protein J3A83DRAFT_4189406 [Scleroderma citrinum]